MNSAKNKIISDRLSRSEKTISVHKSNIVRKPGLKRIPITLGNGLKNSGKNT
ncbi:response regulator transcription factor [Enterobacteriaceae bacterium BIT-l23]|uniref:LuxR C-terminal-related transcriptional regulator n=1 Tax=Jejubacter sp. L23 TaxID=3092086 RepID=UPI00158554CE|nr:response regulator transcription factor [Enterobacteriaceae bacterium BIT-l23]